MYLILFQEGDELFSQGSPAAPSEEDLKEIGKHTQPCTLTLFSLDISMSRAILPISMSPDMLISTGNQYELAWKGTQ